MCSWSTCFTNCSHCCVVLLLSRKSFKSLYEMTLLLQDMTRAYWPASPSNGFLYDDKGLGLYVQRWGPSSDPTYGDVHRCAVATPTFSPTECTLLSVCLFQMLPPSLPLPLPHPPSSPSIIIPLPPPASSLLPLILTPPPPSSSLLPSLILPPPPPSSLIPHFRYDYSDLCTDVTKFPRPRFTSEFGYQSYPSFSSLQNVSNYSVSFSNVFFGGVLMLCSVAVNNPPCICIAIMNSSCG